MFINKKLIILFLFINNINIFYAQAGERQNNPSQARLISSFKRVQPGRSIDIGVYITLKKGWHTYWKNPGDIGQSLRWPESPSFSMSPPLWPLPQKIITQGRVNFIYKKHLLVKRKIHIPEESENQISIVSPLQWLVCKDSCILMKQKVQINLLIGESLKDPSSLKIFQQFIYPQPLDLTGQIKRQKNKDWLFLQSSKPFKLMEFFPIQNLSHQTPIIKQSDSSSTILSLPQSKKLRNNKALVVLKRNNKIQAEEVHFSPQNNSFILMLMMAFLGGLILNFMPCVLPVVFLKFYHTASIPRKKLISSSLLYGAGIILSFLSLAFFIQLLKTGGQTSGWGFQMESPLFVSFLILLFTLISLSFLELLPLPVFLKKSKTQDSFAGSFFSGLLITATASPCTTPFMGAALGYAFSRSLLDIFMIFSSLGLGMASPYFLLCFFPKCLKYFPHPGSWNQKLKKAMSLPMFSTAGWLCFILYQLIDLKLLVVFVTALILLSLALWLKKNQNIKKQVFIGLVSLSALLTLHTLFYANQFKKPLQAEKSFSIEKFNQIHQKNPVLLYFTAPWCLSCQVNEWTTFKDKEVLEFLSQNKIILMKIKWDPENPDISNIFDKHQRAGIPFTLFFPFGDQPEIILPEILTPRLLINLLKKH